MDKINGMQRQSNRRYEKRKHPASGKMPPHPLKAVYKYDYGQVVKVRSLAGNSSELRPTVVGRALSAKGGAA